MVKIKVWSLARKAFKCPIAGFIKPGVNELVANRATQAMNLYKHVVLYKNQDKVQQNDKPSLKKKTVVEKSDGNKQEFSK